MPNRDQPDPVASFGCAKGHAIDAVRALQDRDADPELLARAEAAVDELEAVTDMVRAGGAGFESAAELRSDGGVEAPHACQECGGTWWTAAAAVEHDCPDSAWGDP
jgi:hypothetical protein